MRTPKISIVNIVATATLDSCVNLESLKQCFPYEVVYTPEIYRGRAAYFKSSKMQGKVSIFSSGKMISVGTKSRERAKQELGFVASNLARKGLAQLKSLVKIQNIVATADLGFRLDLDSIKRVGDTQIIYEPEQFPAAILRFKRPTKVTILLFASGKMVITGLRSSAQIEPIVQKLQDFIKINQ